MKYEIDSKELAFSGRGVLSLLRTLNEVAADTGSDFLVVGAFARDLILHNIFNQPAGILTRDVDVGIALANWEAYHSLIDRLVSDYDFIQGREPHVLYTPQQLPVDLLPFGALEKNRSISFPKTDHFSMNMMGFSEALATRLIIRLEGEVEFSIPAPEGMILLKLIAWKDRTPSPTALKHVTDIAQILSHYFEAMADNLDVNPEFLDLYDLGGEPFNFNWYAASAIGRKINKMVAHHPETRVMLLSIFADVMDEKNGRFFRQKMGDTLSEKEDIVIGIIKRLEQELTPN